MPRFHHMWIVGAEVEVRNPAPERDARCEKVFAALVRHASDDTEPYPTQVATFDTVRKCASLPSARTQRR